MSDEGNIRNYRLPDSSSTVWRYMRLAQFMDLIQSKELHFSSIQALRETADVYEGNKLLADYDQEIPEDLPSEERNNREIAYLASAYFVNCWHVNEHESTAMWKLYIGDCDGVAIKSTYGSLRNSIKDDFVKMCMVEYDTTQPKDKLGAILTKLPEFEHERELRLFYGPVQRPDIEETAAYLAVSGQLEKGQRVPVDLDTFIQEIIVSPYSPDWIVNVLQAFVSSLDIPHKIVRKSIFAIPSGSQ